MRCQNLGLMGSSSLGRAQQLLWKDLNFDNILKSRSDFGLIYKSRPLNYLPKNKDFGSNIKIRIVLLAKK